jgi:hypothetical protein
VNDKNFSEERLEHLINMWKPDADPYLASYRKRCGIVYELLRELAKPGGKPSLAAAVQRIGIAESTAWDMRMRHRVQIGEMPDPDAPDPRDEEEGQAQGEEKSKRDTDEPSEPVPGKPAKSEAFPSEPIPAPTECRRRLLVDFDDDDLPEPSGEGK